MSQQQQHLQNSQPQESLQENQTINLQPKPQPQLTQQQIQEEEFRKRLNKAMYKTSYNEIGTKKTNIPEQPRKGISGKFTDHLIYSGMYKNASLNTTGDKERWVGGSKDWMEHLG